MAIRYHKVNKILNYQSDVSGYTMNKKIKVTEQIKWYQQMIKQSTNQKSTKGERDKSNKKPSVVSTYARLLNLNQKSQKM